MDRLLIVISILNTQIKLIEKKLDKETEVITDINKLFIPHKPIFNDLVNKLILIIEDFSDKDLVYYYITTDSKKIKVSEYEFNISKLISALNILNSYDGDKNKKAIISNITKLNELLEKLETSAKQ